MRGAIPRENPACGRNLPARRPGEEESRRTRSLRYHLKGPRFLEFSVDEKASKLRIEALKNTQEESFSRKVGADIPFDLSNLARIQRVPDESETDWVSVFFASVLLQAHLAGHRLPKEITFRKASMPEIESLGKW